MGFFGTNKDSTDNMNISSKEAISSILSQEMDITGEISFKGKTRIDGTVTGNIQGEHLVLSETGKIIGDVEVNSLVCHGTIEGNIKAELITALPTASINGTLVSTNLTVESGAFLNGEIKSSQNSEQSQSTKKPSLTVAKEKKDSSNAT